MFGGGEPPPYNARQTPCKPWTGNGITVSRAACMRPLQTGQRRQANRQGSVCRNQPRRGQDPALQYKIHIIPSVYGRRRHRFAGGMYAAPTHGPNAVTTKKWYRRANSHGGAKAPPYKPTTTSRLPPGTPQRQNPPLCCHSGGFVIQALYVLRGAITPRSRTAGTSSRRGCARCPAGTGSAARSRCSTQRGCSPCPPSGYPRPCAAAHSG